MNIKLITALWLITALSVFGYQDTITDFELVRVRDGDTFIINIPNIPDVFGKQIAVRIRGIDTPELKDEREGIRKQAYLAKAELERLLTQPNAKITLHNLGRDKYFRLLASVKVGDTDIAEHMIKKGLAKRYNGGAKVW